MKRPLLILCLPLAACAATTASQSAAPVAPSLTAEQIVAARHASFMLSAATFGGMRATVEQGGDVKPLAFGARGLAAWAQTLPTMFPQGTQLPSSHAKPAVWQNRADFEAKAAAFQAATASLVQAAQAGDAAAFKSAYGATGAACKACHDLYRLEDHH
ncbi:cytochrome c [Sphingomonas parva]|uniref:Cytochrome c n=1 Tax=Sphingomonas parva TaxID=2555898 RepID=A0A4Y8ZVV1_9SPHN|nr:cytochrome c [Sphingomonas parva]TFI60140.1 cytochrome c [Sphingomonas parva]